MAECEHSQGFVITINIKPGAIILFKSIPFQWNSVNVDNTYDIFLEFYDDNKIVLLV